MSSAISYKEYSMGEKKSHFAQRLKCFQIVLLMHPIVHFSNIILKLINFEILVILETAMRSY